MIILIYIKMRKTSSDRDHNISTVYSLDPFWSCPMSSDNKDNKDNGRWYPGKYAGRSKPVSSTSSSSSTEGDKWYLGRKYLCKRLSLLLSQFNR